MDWENSTYENDHSAEATGAIILLAITMAIAVGSLAACHFTRDARWAALVPAWIGGISLAFAHYRHFPALNILGVVGVALAVIFARGMI